MSDLVSTARSARESLKRGLAALQSPGVPDQLFGVAEPIASAMTSLHEIEESRGATRELSAPRALAEVRKALNALQADTSGHPAVQAASEAVAGSLGFVFGLVSGAPLPQAIPDTYASATNRTGPEPKQAAPRAAEPAPRSSIGPVLRVKAGLGVYSPTNFYRGLGGNDVVEHGGLFVATYAMPEIGREVLLEIALPGGYEFEARGVVRWTREAPHSGTNPGESPPGFGAQLTQISAEARKLVQRYVKNREPLFHDEP